MHSKAFCGVDQIQITLEIVRTLLNHLLVLSKFLLFFATVAAEVTYIVESEGPRNIQQNLACWSFVQIVVFELFICQFILSEYRLDVFNGQVEQSICHDSINVEKREGGCDHAKHDH